MRKCEIDGCTNSHRAKGLCIVHYNHLVRYGESQGKFETKFRNAERDYIIERIKDQICFDALADHHEVAQFRGEHPSLVGRCKHHGGKCSELLSLILELQKGNK